MAGGAAGRLVVCRIARFGQQQHFSFLWGSFLPAPLNRRSAAAFTDWGSLILDISQCIPCLDLQVLPVSPDWAQTENLLRTPIPRAYAKKFM